MGIIEKVYDGTPVGNLMRKLLVDLHTIHEFLYDLSIRLMEERKIPGKKLVDADYHEK
ncbi:hypothetical protein BU26DRAFT_571357 [Trematosphaeria pertusa]|uniref:Uncharacterized protein n=1 Tax=Trematosphaeria pertusa TaxID=390896 RepID=A0A6A6HVR1_9PLEO|nr:uncharacterized protein BU26DRAFT_571357 [Trematosphaeria pertusa]KAF2242121.1 hypothetical protein BU26DRAFT_571357 [Trematosphaeria pertusa]